MSERKSVTDKRKLGCMRPTKAANAQESQNSNQPFPWVVAHAAIKIRMHEVCWLGAVCTHERAERMQIRF